MGDPSIIGIITTESDCLTAWNEYVSKYPWLPYSDFKQWYCVIDEEVPPLTYPELSTGDSMDAIAATMSADVQATLLAVEKFLEGMFGTIGTWLFHIVEGVYGTFEDIQRWLQYDMETLNQAILAIESSIKSAVESISHDIEDTIGYLGGEVQVVYERVSDWLESVYLGVQEAIISAYNLTLEAFKQALSYANAQTSSIWDAIGALINGAAAIVVEVIKGLAATVTSLIDASKEAINFAVGKVAEWVVHAIDTVSKWIEGILDAILPALEEIMTDLLSVIRPFFEWLSESIDIDTSTLTDAIASILEPLAKMQIELSEKLSKRILFPEG